MTMFLPTVDVTTENPDEDTSDASSLTEAPFSVMDVDEDFVSSPDSEVSPIRDLSRRRNSSRFVVEDEDEDEDDGDGDESEDGPAIDSNTIRQRRDSSRTRFSELENVPVEASDSLFQFLARNFASDTKLAPRRHYNSSYRWRPIQSDPVWQSAFQEAYARGIRYLEGSISIAIRLSQYQQPL